MDGLFDDLIPQARPVQQSNANPFADLIPQKAAPPPGVETAEEMTKEANEMFGDLLPGEKSGDFMTGVKQGGRALEQGAGSTLEVLGRFTGSEGLTKTGEGIRKDAVEGAKENPLAVGRLEDIHGVGDAADYAQGVVGQQAPIMGGILASQLAGGAVAGPVGAMIAGGLTSYGINLGDLYSTLVEEGMDPDKAKTWAAAGTIPIAILDSVTPGGIASRLLGHGAKKEIVRSLMRRIAGEAVKTSLKEGATEATQEGLQEAIEAGALDQTLEQRGGMSRVLNAGAAGVLTGLGFGAAEGVKPDVKKGAGGGAPPVSEEGGTPPPPPDDKGGAFASPVPEFIKGAKPAEDVSISSPSNEGGKINTPPDDGAPPGGSGGTFKVDPADYGVDVQPAAAEPSQEAKSAPAAPVDAEEEMPAVEPAKAAEEPTAEAVKTPAEEAPKAVEPVPDRSKFRRDISRASGQKGLPVYFHGEGAGYDPLLHAITVGHDVAPEKTAAAGIGQLAKEPPAPEWRAATVKATLDDGTVSETPAGQAADNIGERIKRAMSVLECLG